MFLVLAGLLVAVWIIAFLVVHVSGLAIHVLIGLALASALFHFVRPRRYLAPADAPTPKDAVK